MFRLKAYYVFYNISLLTIRSVYFKRIKLLSFTYSANLIILNN